MAKKIEWPGVLNEPIQIMHPWLMHPKEIDEQFRLRLQALFKFCNVTPSTPDHWQEIAMELAVLCVPGFSRRLAVSKKRGVWKDFKGVELYADVQWLVRAGKHTERGACSKLPKQSRFSTRYSGMNNSSLWRRYQEVKKDHWFLTPFLKNTFGNPKEATKKVIEHFALFGSSSLEK